MNYRRRPHRRFVFIAFFALFGGLSLLFLMGVAAAFFFARKDFIHEPRPPFNPLVCLVPIIFLGLGTMLARYWFLHFATPFAGIMSAAEAVAQGDLSVRLAERGPRPLQDMARSFNHMTGELARADQLRRNLTADIAHELRNPLHIIQGNLEGMLDGVYEPTPETLEATLDETRLVGRLVADLQTLSLAEAGQLPLHPTQFPVADLLEDVVASFSARSSGLDVDLLFEADPGISLNADYDRLDQALSNLVANALHYTPAGGRITLRAETHSDRVRITVADNGAGIPAEDLPYIFNRFWKGDRARTRDGSSGSGLGLAITLQLVRAHGGDLRAASQVGQGTTFTLELPLTKTHLGG